MKKSKVLSLLLSLSLLASLVLPGALALPTRAADGQDKSGMVISKTATANTDGSYTITLEAYATGEKVISEVKEDVPTDIVLVLDQSGSMTNQIGEASFSPYQASQSTNVLHYNRRHNGGSGNLWYSLGDGSYAAVSVEKQETLSYNPLSTGLVNYDENWRGNLTTNCYYYYANNLYEKVGEEYKKVTLTESSSGPFWNRTYTYTYTFSSDGTTVTSVGRNVIPQLGEHGPLYYITIDAATTVYTYSYTDTNGEIHTIGTSTGDNTRFNTTLYERTINENAGGSRLNALKTAVTNFAKAVENKAAGPDGDLSMTEDNVNHRIAVVGFASGSYFQNTNYDYGNTEVFVGSNQYKYGTSAQSVYTSAFQDMNTTQGQSNVSASINALDANGGTLIDLGVEMANGILNANPVSAGEKRNRVIVVFTDGQPGWSGYDGDVAQSAIDEAQLAKNNGVTVYTVGIFSGADATSAGSNSDDATAVQKSNWFMQNLSSNNGTVQTPSYYLSAADANTLNNIFQQISDQIESGGSSTTLSSETVIKDIISPSFALPANATAADITLETYQCTGKNDDVYTWSKNATEMGAQATVNGDQVSVSGFDFADNYVGTVTDAGGNVTYRGHKLVISFTVTPKTGFLGGNDVYTNTMAGIYENASATEPVLTFERPQVNVPIQDISITKSDKNVYLLENLTAAQIRSGVSVKVGNVDLSLDPTANNYGLEAWQTEYVTISTSILDENNLPVSDLKALTSDKTYSISVSVAPRTPTPASNQGQVAVEQTGSDFFKINVFKPVLTFKDGTVDYGSTINTTNYFSDKTQKSYESDNYVSTKLKWMHESTDSANVTMLGTEPVLTKSYQYDITPSKVDAAGKVISKDFVGVDVTVKIGSTDVTQYVTFAHDACASSDCTWDSDKGNFEFLLHVINKCADLTIQKLGIDQIDNDGTKEAQSVIFHIKGKTNGIELDVVIHGNGQKVIKDLPIDTYIVTEKTDWSWRYTPDNDSQEISLDAGAANSLTFTNTRTNSYWLNGGNYAHNVFGN